MKHILNISVLLILLVSLFAFRVDAEAPEVKVQDMTIKDQVTYYSNLHGVDPNLALSMMQCESKGKQGAKGDGNRASGIFQYWNDTWNRHSLKYFGVILDKNSAHDQAKLATAAIAGGDGREWTSYRALMNGGSYTFFYKLEQKWITVRCNYL